MTRQEEPVAFFDIRCSCGKRLGWFGMWSERPRRGRAMTGERVCLECGATLEASS